MPGAEMSDTRHLCGGRYWLSPSRAWMGSTQWWALLAVSFKGLDGLHSMMGKVSLGLTRHAQLKMVFPQACMRTCIKKAVQRWITGTGVGYPLSGINPTFEVAV
eukprot:1155981-Pelagomonas_calceolata.AAC.3